MDEREGRRQRYRLSTLHSQSLTELAYPPPLRHETKSILPKPLFSRVANSFRKLLFRIPRRYRNYGCKAVDLLLSSVSIQTNAYRGCGRWYMFRTRPRWTFHTYAASTLFFVFEWLLNLTLKINAGTKTLSKNFHSRKTSR